MARGTTDRIGGGAIGPGAGSAAIAAGDYVCSERELFYVEQLGDGRALLEDCRTGDLVDVPVGELALLRLLDRA